MYVTGDIGIPFTGESSLINHQERKVFATPAEELFFSPQKPAKDSSPHRSKIIEGLLVGEGLGFLFLFFNIIFVNLFWYLKIKQKKNIIRLIK